MARISQIKTSFCLLLLAALFTLPLTAANPWAAKHGMTSAQYQAAFNQYDGDGYRLNHISGFSVNGTAYFNAVWEQKNGPDQYAKHNLTSAQYQTEATQKHSQGYRIVLVDGYNVGSTPYYTAIWEKTTGPALISKHGLTSAEYQAEYNQNKNAGYRLVHVDGMGIGNTAYYAAIWEKTDGPLLVAKHGLTSAQYQAEVSEWAPKGYRLTCLSTYNLGNADYYAFIMEKTSGPAWNARHDMNSSVYQSEFENRLYTGFKPTIVTGCSTGSAQYAAVWQSTGVWSTADLNHVENTVKAFMNKYNVPGASMAITKDGNLVYARGFGKADQSTGELVDPSSLFRIASVSKPITGAAIMKLEEQNKLELTDKVFGEGALLGTTYGSTLSTREKNIRVKNLLEHTAGGNPWDNDMKDGDTWNDPMFQNNSANHKDLITQIIKDREPDADAGDTYAYSNFGFCVLGRIIEKETGQSYETWVKNNILAPSGITGMSIGGDTKAQKKAREVVYYGQNGDDPYAWKVGRMDAHGGWIATPIDLVRFATHVDDFPTVPDILSGATIDKMTTGSSANPGYAKGWNINGNNWFHMGSLPGTGAVFVRTGSGYTWAFLVNTKSNADAFFGDMDKMMWDVVNGIDNWPTGTDFF